MTLSTYRRGDHGPAVAQIRDHLALLGLLTQRAGRAHEARVGRARSTPRSSARYAPSSSSAD